MLNAQLEDPIFRLGAMARRVLLWARQIVHKECGEALVLGVVSQRAQGVPDRAQVKGIGIWMRSRQPSVAKHGDRTGGEGGRRFVRAQKGLGR